MQGHRFTKGVVRIGIVAYAPSGSIESIIGGHIDDTRERSISRPAADTSSGSETPDDAAGSSGRR